MPSATETTPLPTPTINIPKSPRSPKPSLPSIKSSISTALPSELPNSPALGRLEVIKQEEDLKTPITPPTAYTEFLKALSPAISTPSTGRSPLFDRLYSGKSTPITQPNSAASCSCSTKDIPAPLKTASSAPIIPPSPYMRPPKSARTPTALRKLRIPQSPLWSPVTESPHNSSTSRSPLASADWNTDRMKRIYESPQSATHTSVSVRQVVTRTVTYTRTPITPLDPAPKGKKRRVE
ncbi:MAG: hypothetical protein Q9217_007042 [Psora testacea]